MLRPSLLRFFHRAAGHALRKAGYRWERRRAGELQLGIWRKRWTRQGRKRSSAPRRLVLVPGFGDTPLSWMMVLTMIAPTIRKNFDEIALFDFPGYAGFLSHERPYHSMDLLRDAVFDAMDSLQPDTVLGHSLGGWLAAMYAVESGIGKRPRLRTASAKPNYAGPARIILINASGVFECEQDRDELQRKFLSAIAAKEESIHVIRPHLFAREPLWFKVLAPELSRFFLQSEVEQFINSFRAEHMLADRLETIRCRVWLISGELDTLIPPKCISLWLAKLNSREKLARALTLKGAGHSPQIESPAALGAVLNQILATEPGAEPQYLDLPVARRWWRLVDDSGQAS